jgi:LysR family transcriptional regulator, regulator for bpeEF and oprC
MLDLNDLRVFASVARLSSFSAAARELGLPKSSVSRSVTRLEGSLHTRLVQRTTREVRLTPSGIALQQRCLTILADVGDAVDYVGSLSSGPRGLLRISTGIGFGVNVLSELLPPFLKQYPEVNIALDLNSRSIDLVADAVDVTVRIGPMPDSEMVATHLGTIHRHLCAAPDYLMQHGTPETVEALSEHDIVEMPSSNGLPRPWSFSREGISDPVIVEIAPRISVNDPVTIHRLVVNGAGVGCISGYLCSPDIAAGRLVRLLPEWNVPSVDVSLVFPSSRELSPAVRAFVGYMKTASAPGKLWQNDAVAR